MSSMGEACQNQVYSYSVGREIWQKSGLVLMAILGERGGTRKVFYRLTMNEQLGNSIVRDFIFSERAHNGAWRSQETM
jgi:hypothetical protein